MSTFPGFNIPTSARGNVITTSLPRDVVQAMFSVMDSTSPTSLDVPDLPPLAGGSGRTFAYRSYHGHTKDSDCIPRDIISLKQVTDCPLDPIFDMLGEREFLIKKLHLKRTNRARQSRRAALLSQIR